MKALVTGGAGFIGSHVCEALLQRGWQVTCVDNFSTGRSDNIQRLPALRVVEGDVNDGSTFGQLSGERFDVVFHYAATVGVRRTEEQPELVFSDVLGIRNVALLARQGVVGRVVYASSSEVYGEPQRLPEVEDDGVVAWNPYASVKLYGEHVFKAVWTRYHVPTVSLRFFNVYGPRQASSAYGFVTAQFFDHVMSDMPPTVFGDGTQTRDFVFIQDNVRAALAAVECSAAYGGAINVGTGRETRVVDLARAVIRVAGREGVLEPAFLPARNVDVYRRCASVERLQRLLGVSCDTSLDDGLRVMLLSVGTDGVALSQRQAVLSAANS